MGHILGLDEGWEMGDRDPGFFSALRGRRDGSHPSAEGAAPSPLAPGQEKSGPEEDPWLAAARDFATGDQRGALGLLYRAGLWEVTERHGIEFPPGATEGDCLRWIRALGRRDLTALFQELIPAWQAVAYGGATLAKGRIDALGVLWRRGFPAEAPRDG